jgi:LPXTG-motif cell wall-anchored protein
VCHEQRVPRRYDDATQEAQSVGLLYGGITYTTTTHDAKLGPIELSIKDRETVNIPVWAGVGAIVVGGALLLLRRKD